VEIVVLGRAESTQPLPEILEPTDKERLDVGQMPHVFLNRPAEVNGPGQEAGVEPGGDSFQAVGGAAKPGQKTRENAYGIVKLEFTVNPFGLGEHDENPLF